MGAREYQIYPECWTWYLTSELDIMFNTRNKSGIFIDKIEKQ
jgi:hypothetical protein